MHENTPTQLLGSYFHGSGGQGQRPCASKWVISLQAVLFFSAFVAFLGIACAKVCE